MERSIKGGGIMKAKTKRIIGHTMVATPFIGLFIGICYALGGFKALIGLSGLAIWFLTFFQIRF